MNTIQNPPIMKVDPYFSTSLTGQCDCDCDCACGDLVFEAATLPLPSLATFVQRAGSSSVMALDREQYLVFSPNHMHTVMNQSALSFLSSYDSARSIADIPEIWQNKWGLEISQSLLAEMIRLRLIQPIGETNPLADSSKSLTGWIHITDRCNLRCSYCYLPHHPKDMSSQTGRSAIETIFRSAVAQNYKSIKIKYAGGEPLLGLERVLELQRYALELGKQHQIEIDGIVLSNGTLLSASVIELLKQAGIRLMVSLDGISKFHDEQRSFASGYGSFHQVSTNIDLALQMGLKPEISVTISSQNSQGLVDLVDWLADRELHFSFNFQRENPNSLCQPVYLIDQDSFVSDLEGAFKQIALRLPNRSLLKSLADRANLAVPHNKTCGVGQNYFAISTDGEIAKCQMALNENVSTIHAQDPIEDIRQDMVGIQNLPVDQKSGCSECRWKYWCGGGCPLAAFQAYGRYDTRSPYCEIYKRIFPKILFLEGIRIAGQPSLKFQ